MSISENILLFISGAGILQAIFLSTLVYFHPKSERSNSRFLSIYIVSISIPMLLPLAQHFLPWQRMIFLAPFTLLQGPLLYLYVRSFKEIITWEKAWPHFLLFVVYIFIISIISSVIGSKYPPARDMPSGVLQNPVTIIPISLRYVQMIIYFFLARKELNMYRRSIQHLFSETSRINLSWVRLLVNGYIILVFSTIALYSVALRHAESFSLLLLINAAVVSPYIYMATYRGIYQPAIWQIQPGMTKEKVEEEMSKAEVLVVSGNGQNHPSPNLKAENNKISEIVNRIISVIDKEKLYRESELTLQILADKIQYPSYQVSQAINEGMKKNFYDLINGYRVEEAKRLLLDSGNKNYTILSIGFEAGFNSKTTFNTVFKKITGLTPTEFRQRQRVGLVSA